MTPERPGVSDTWSGGRSETARLLGIDPKTLDRYAALGSRRGGIDFTVGASGRRRFSGCEVKRFWEAH